MMRTSLAALGFIGTLAFAVACSSGVSDSGATDDELVTAPAQCGSPVSMTAADVGQYVLNASKAGNGTVLLSLTLRSDGRFQAVEGKDSLAARKSVAIGKGAPTLRGTYRLEKPDCPTSDRRLVLSPEWLEGLQPAARTLTLKPTSQRGVFEFAGDGFNTFSMAVDIGASTNNPYGEGGAYDEADGWDAGSFEGEAGSL